jgi:hypothetical protein
MRNNRTGARRFVHPRTDGRGGWISGRSRLVRGKVLNHAVSTDAGQRGPDLAMTSL